MPAKNQIPQSFIRTLNEHTTGGYLICYFDLDGNPQIQCEFDNMAYSLAAQRHVEQWMKAISECQIDTMKNAISGIYEEESKEDGDDDGAEES